MNPAPMQRGRVREVKGNPNAPKGLNGKGVVLLKHLKGVYIEYMP